jgi:RNA polymerase sigma-70 factor, ECF subfamily
MNETSPAGDSVTATFERERARLIGLSYRLLGSLTDAQDVVQDAWLRWDRADHQAIERPEAWLTTVVSRLGLDLLRARQRARTEYVGPWLPEPLIRPLTSTDPAQLAEVADSLTTAYLVLLEALTPAERLVLLLADVFAEPFASIATTLGKSEVACRKIAQRARSKIATSRAARSSPPFPRAGPGGDLPGDRMATAWEFSAAVLSGDVDHVISLLSDDAVLVSDGGKHRHAARRPVRERHRIARLLCNLANRAKDAARIEPVWINGNPGMLAVVDDVAVISLSLEIHEQRVTDITIVVNPDKLAHARSMLEIE